MTISSFTFEIFLGPILCAHYHSDLGCILDQNKMVTVTYNFFENVLCIILELYSWDLFLRTLLSQSYGLLYGFSENSVVTRLF